MSFPTLPPAPAAPSRGQESTLFNTRMQAMMAYIEMFPDQWNALAALADEEIVAIVEARDAAIAAATASTLGTSASSVAIGTGAKTFVTQAAKNWTVGSWLVIASTANPTNFMTGQVTAYSGTALDVNVVAVGGGGTFADWNIGLAGARGPAGQNGNGAWSQIGSTVNTTSGSLVTFSNIPDGYSDLLFTFGGVSGSSTGDLLARFSDNSTDFTDPMFLTGSSSASSTFRGGLFIPRYRSGDFAVLNAGASATSPRGGGYSAVGGLAVTLPGPLTHVRFSLDTGTFDAGAIALYGRLQV